jgi:broad specificity phosphatase PhoE
MNPTLLITSEYQRTQETARIIGSILGLTPTVQTLFHEVRRPSSLYGLSHYHPKTIRYVLGSVVNRNNPKWRIEDAENFSDIRSRIDAALNFLESYATNHQSIIVVSHTIFINLISAYMCHNRNVSLRILVPHLTSIMHMKNTEITHLTHHNASDEGICEWMRAP